MFIMLRVNRTLCGQAKRSVYQNEPLFNNITDTLLNRAVSYIIIFYRNTVAPKPHDNIRTLLRCSTCTAQYGYSNYYNSKKMAIIVRKIFITHTYILLSVQSIYEISPNVITRVLFDILFTIKSTFTLQLKC